MASSIWHGNDKAGCSGKSGRSSGSSDHGSTDTTLAPASTGRHRDGNDDGEPKRRTLQCSSCNEPGKMQDLLLLGTDWQSSLPLCCFKCQEVRIVIAFKVEVMRRWKQRKSYRTSDAQIVRTANWRRINAEIDARYAGESQKTFRKRLREAFYMTAHGDNR